MQSSLRSPLVSTALLAVVLGLTLWTRAPEIALLCLLPALVVFLWRSTRASRAGLTLFLIGTLWLGRIAIQWIYRGDAWAPWGLPEAGSAVLALSVLVFALAPAWNKNTIAVQLACAAGALVSLVLWWLVVPPLGEQAARDESIRKHLDTMVTFRALINELEAIRSTRGSYPVNPDEWVAIRGTPLPETEYGSQFVYQGHGDRETGGLSYQLCFVAGFFGNVHIYDSTTPERGIFMVPW